MQSYFFNGWFQAPCETSNLWKSNGGHALFSVKSVVLCHERVCNFQLAHLKKKTDFHNVFSTTRSLLGHENTWRWMVHCHKGLQVYCFVFFWRFFYRIYYCMFMLSLHIESTDSMKNWHMLQSKKLLSRVSPSKALKSAENRENRARRTQYLKWHLSTVMRMYIFHKCPVTRYVPEACTRLVSAFTIAWPLLFLSKKRKELCQVTPNRRS